MAITKSQHKIISINGDTTAINNRITYLENNEYKVAYFSEINSQAGTITIPTEATILLDQFSGGADAFTNIIENNQPVDGEFPRDIDGNEIDVTSFDAAGNYVLSGAPSAYPVALVYYIKIKGMYYQNLDDSKILGYQDLTSLQAQMDNISANVDLAIQTNHLYLTNR